MEKSVRYEPFRLKPTLLRIENGREQTTERRGNLSGYLRDVATGPADIFWLGILGVARYAPPTWSAPPAAPKIEKQVYSIHEDDQRRLWFLSTDTLVLCEDGQWSTYRLPERTSASGQIQSVCWLLIKHI